MQCRMHPTTSASNMCSECGTWVCDACTITIENRLFCRPCLAKLAVEPKEKSVRGYSWGLLILLSCILPGVNYMYLGLVKRGLAAVSFFFVLVYLMAVTIWPVTLMFGMGAAVFWLTCIFDGINIRRRLEHGESVPDGIEDILPIIQRHKTKIACVIILIIAFIVISTVISLLLRLLPLVIIVLGLYVLFKGISKR